MNKWRTLQTLIWIFIYFVLGYLLGKLLFTDGVMSDETGKFATPTATYIPASAKPTARAFEVLTGPSEIPVSGWSTIFSNLPKEWEHRTPQFRLDFRVYTHQGNLKFYLTIFGETKILEGNLTEGGYTFNDYSTTIGMGTVNKMVKPCGVDGDWSTGTCQYLFYIWYDGESWFFLPYDWYPIP